MKTRILCALLSLLAVASPAATTINPANRYAYGANVGWMDWRGDTTSGAVVGEYVCSGYLYAANVGWVHLGNGVPASGIQYANKSGTDYGVNRDGVGNLRGYAYGANIGWVNFESNGAPRVDLATGRLSGDVYSANCGWISLSNAFAYVQTDAIVPGVDTDSDGITDGWELSYTNTLTAFTTNGDVDGDGVSDRNEYLADTNPKDATDRLAITHYLTTPDGTLTELTWKSKLTRYYHVEKTSDLTSSFWLDSGLGLIAPDGSATTRMFGDTNSPQRFLRVRVVRPLSP